MGYSFVIALMNVRPCILLFGIVWGGGGGRSERKTLPIAYFNQFLDDRNIPCPMAGLLHHLSPTLPSIWTLCWDLASIHCFLCINLLPLNLGPALFLLAWIDKF